MNSGPHKLYTLTSPGCTLPLHVNSSKVYRHPAHDIPQLYWPDGTVCWLANLYLLSGFRKGRSRKNKGGTLLTWSKNLSHLIRWCYQNKTDFIDLTDSCFRMFVNSLLAEQEMGEKKRSEQHVSNICSTVLNFLAFVDEKIPGLDLLGPTGRIHAEKQSYQVKSERSGQPIMRTAWTHECLPRQRRARRRQPISTNAVNLLYEANTRVEATAFIARRRFVMLRLLEITGGRRIELSLIEIGDIESAFKTGQLKVFTAKRHRDDSFRYVPVTQADLRELTSFVKHYRQRVIRNTIGLINDHGRLFVSESTGKPLETNTLGSELYILRKEAGIDDEEVCMHAFRHRYITNIFRDLIKTHYYQNPDELRRALLSTESLKVKVMEWTGHRSIESLNHYIHLAFEVETDFHRTLDLLQAQRVIHSLRTMLKNYTNQLKTQSFPLETVDSLVGMIETASSELGDLLDSSKVVV